MSDTTSTKGTKPRKGHSDTTGNSTGGNDEESKQVRASTRQRKLSLVGLEALSNGWSAEELAASVAKASTKAATSGASASTPAPTSMSSTAIASHVADVIDH